jgi:hypothetical protein
MSTDLRKPTLIESIALGGASCVFTVNFTHPIELVKTRMQVSGNGLGATVGSTFAKEGAGAFWKGIVWAWGREASYASIKLGAYAPVRDAIGAGNKDCEWLRNNANDDDDDNRRVSIIMEWQNSIFYCFAYNRIHFCCTVLHAIQMN